MRNPIMGLALALVASAAGCSPAAAPATVAPILAPTLVPSPTPAPTPTLDPNDTSAWLPFTSDRYGFSMAYPPDWEATHASGTWTFPEDTAWPDGVEHGDWFYLDGEEGSVAASTWSVALEPGTTADQWFLEYCAVEVTPCNGAEAKVAASLDGHPGWLVPADDPQAYFGIDGRIYLFVVWQPDYNPALVRYGGGLKLVETFVSTMRLLPPAAGQP